MVGKLLVEMEKQVLLLYITPLGQLELFRQRFRGLKTPGAELRPALPLPPARRMLASQLQDGA